MATAVMKLRVEISSRSGSISSKSDCFIQSPHGPTFGAANNGSLCPFLGVLGATDDHWHKRVPRVAMRRTTMDVGLASSLHPILGLGQFASLVRCRRYSCRRRFLVGEL